MSVLPSYPNEILPNSNYKVCIGTDPLLEKYPRLLLVRMVDGYPEEYVMKGENGEIVFSDRVFKNNMANLSLNLAGGLFDTTSGRHLNFLPIKEVASAWTGEDIPSYLFDDTNTYIFYETCFGLCFYVSDIHNRTFPFYKHFESQQERDEYACRVQKIASEEEMKNDARLVGAFESKKKNILVHPRLRVHHAPTKANYWHMTLDTYRPTDIDYIRPEDKLNNSDKSMFKALKQDLLTCCEINLQPEYTIDEVDYINQINF